MGKKSDPPPGPDWNALIAMSKEFQADNKEIYEEYMEFQKGAYADQKAIQDEMLKWQLPAAEDEASLAQDLRDRYRDMGIPFEEKYVDELANWDTAGRRDERAGEAQAAIEMAQEAARESELRRLEGYGIDPSQTRSAALDSRLRHSTALAKAAAGNQERKQVEKEGLQYGATAVDLMRAWPNIGGQSMSTALAVGNSSLGNQQSVDGYMGQSYPTGSNILAQGYNAVQGAYGTAGNIYQSQLAAHEMKTRNSPWGGVGNLVGIGIGAAGQAGGFGNLLGFAEGGPTDGAKPAAEPRPVHSGIPQDNVPAMLSEGEFVIPDDVARWEGEKNLQKLINKAREDKKKTDFERTRNQQALGIPA